jgi:hypothetical protein
MALDGAQRSVKVEYTEPGVSFGMIARNDCNTRIYRKGSQAISWWTGKVVVIKL